MADSNVFDQVNKATANALKKQRMRKMASQTAKQASGTARRAAEGVADAGSRASQERQRRIELARRDLSNHALSEAPEEVHKLLRRGHRFSSGGSL